MNKAVTGLLTLILIGIVMWLGVTDGGGVISKPAINTVISIGLSMIILDIVAGLILTLAIAIFITLMQQFIGNTVLGVILQLLFIIGVPIPTNFLVISKLGDWIGFFPSYPAHTAWIIASCIVVINMIFLFVSRKE